MNWHADDGTAGPIEMLSIVMFALATLVFLGYLGRMNTAATRITSSARTSARAASLAATPEDGRSAAQDAIARSGMNGLCARPPTVDFLWTPSGFGTWFGGSATVHVSCVVTNQTLSGVSIPGDRTITVSDTQPVDAFQATP